MKYFVMGQVGPTFYEGWVDAADPEQAAREWIKANRILDELLGTEIWVAPYKCVERFKFLPNPTLTRVTES